MKRILAFLLFLIMPTLCFALSDACTNPSEYTVDRRCYVTEEQKQKKPYNAVVGLLDEKDNINCTGTVVKDEDGKLYVYTAKHCVMKSDDTVRDKIKVKLQTGHTVYVNYKSSGNFLQTRGYEAKYRVEDWAVYSFSENDLQFVNVTQTQYFRLSDDAIVIGYGTLKIMSNEDIKNFKQKYIDYLLNVKHIKVDTNDKYYRAPGIYPALGIDTQDENVINFLCEGLKNDEYEQVFKDKKLKVSKCKYLRGKGLYGGCQVWSGNSGGGVFDLMTSDLLAILVRGLGYIGTKEHHARSNGNDSAIDVIKVTPGVSSYLE